MRKSIVIFTITSLCIVNNRMATAEKISATSWKSSFHELVDLGKKHKRVTMGLFSTCMALGAFIGHCIDKKEEKEKRKKQRISNKGAAPIPREDAQRQQTTMNNSSKGNNITTIPDEYRRIAEAFSKYQVKIFIKKNEDDEKNKEKNKGITFNPYLTHRNNLLYNELPKSFYRSNTQGFNVQLIQKKMDEYIIEIDNKKISIERFIPCIVAILYIEASKPAIKEQNRKKMDSLLSECELNRKNNDRGYVFDPIP